MSYNHTTRGGEAYKGFLKALEVLGIRYDEDRTAEDQPRKAYFRARQPVDTGITRQLIVEEYLLIRDADCDGTDVVAIEVYEAGQRPDLEARTKVYNDFTEDEAVLFGY